jgi:Ca2+-transporting ATPase
MSAEKIWHNLSVSEAIESLNSGIQGLTREEAGRRLAQYGPNELVEKKKTPPWMLFLEQFKNFLIIILLVAAAVSGVLALTGEGDIWNIIPITVVVQPKAKSFIPPSQLYLVFFGI